MKIQISKPNIFTLFAQAHTFSGMRYDHLYLGVHNTLDEAVTHIERINLEKFGRDLREIKFYYHTNLDLDKLLEHFHLGSASQKKQQSSLIRLIIETRDNELLEKTKHLFTSYERLYINDKLNENKRTSKTQSKVRASKSVHREEGLETKEQAEISYTYRNKSRQDISNPRAS